MQQMLERDAWHIDPVTATVQPVDLPRDPVVVVVERHPSLSIAIGEVCHFLRIRIEQVAVVGDLPQALQDVRPIALLSEAGSVDCDVYDLLMSIASYDPGLPVLMVLDDNLAAIHALEGARKLWQLSDVVRVAQRPGIRGLIDFLFLAGRKSGTGQLVPV